MGCREAALFNTSYKLVVSLLGLTANFAFLRSAKLLIAGNRCLEILPRKNKKAFLWKKNQKSL